MKAWKLFRKMKSGSIRSLFIHNKVDLPIDTWIEAECFPTKGFAIRKGWHCCFVPEAPHLKTEGRVWREVEIEDVTEFTRPICQGGTWLLAQRLRILPEEGDPTGFLPIDAGWPENFN